jgi:DtxR family Mn-dependent transcriptional regulator
VSAKETISASLEDYLEAIIVAARAKGSARVKDIAARLKVTNASVTGALHALSEKRLINYTPYEVITLTAEGERLAQGVLRRHETLKDFLVKVLAVEEPDAESAACSMEHALPRPVVERLVQFMEFMKSHDRGTDRWAEHFADFREKHEKTPPTEGGI